METNEGAWGWGCGREGALVLVYRVTRIGLTVSGNQKFHGEGRVMQKSGEQNLLDAKVCTVNSEGPRAGAEQWE